MRTTLTLILSVALLAAMAPPGAAAETEEQTKIYIAGGWLGTLRSNDVYVGVLKFEVEPSDEILIDIRDVGGHTVGAYVSFHEDNDASATLTGSADDSLGTKEICHSAILDVPEGATHMRVILNSPEAQDNLDCHPQTATWGTVTVGSTN